MTFAACPAASFHRKRTPDRAANRDMHAAITRLSAASSARGLRASDEATRVAEKTFDRAGLRHTRDAGDAGIKRSWYLRLDGGHAGVWNAQGTAKSLTGSGASTFS